MITISDLSKLWVSITSQAGQNIGRRADSQHPMDFFISFDENQHMQMMLLADFQPSLPNSSQQILVRCNARSDGRYAVCFALENINFKEQFIFLCWDIMNCTLKVSAHREGVNAAVMRFVMWQRLLASQKKQALSEADIKGLIGELSVLKEICIPRYGAETAVSGWIGPVGADRDFEFADYWYESKYLSLSMDKIRISSFDQLDIDDDGYLIICRGEKTSAAVTGSFTLNDLVNDIAEKLSSEANALALFKNRLVMYGYNSGDDCSEQPYILNRMEYYRVGGMDFPRIRRSELHHALIDGEYSISVAAIQQWKKDDIADI